MQDFMKSTRLERLLVWKADVPLVKTRRDMHALHIQAFKLGMPRKYSEHYLCNQVSELRFKPWQF
jgi:hypothetical protein